MTTKTYLPATRLVTAIQCCRAAIRGGAHWLASTAKAGFAKDLKQLAAEASKAAAELERRSKKTTTKKPAAGKHSGSSIEAGRAVGRTPTSTRKVGATPPAPESYQPAASRSTASCKPSKTSKTTTGSGAATKQPQPVVEKLPAEKFGTQIANGNTVTLKQELANDGTNGSRENQRPGTAGTVSTDFLGTQKPPGEPSSQTAVQRTPSTFKWDLRQWSYNRAETVWLLAGKLKDLVPRFNPDDFADRRLVIGIAVLAEAGAIEREFFTKCCQSLSKHGARVRRGGAYLYAVIRELCRKRRMDFDGLLAQVYIPPPPQAA
jgi:hypothetical protein